LQTQADISLSIVFDNGVIIFLQSQSDNYEMAGITNYLSSSMGQGKFIYGMSQTVTIDLSSIGGSWLVGVINPHPSTVGFSI
jgi:hypothetical protein